MLQILTDFFADMNNLSYQHNRLIFIITDNKNSKKKIQVLQFTNEMFLFFKGFLNKEYNLSVIVFLNVTRLLRSVKSFII